MTRVMSTVGTNLGVSEVQGDVWSAGHVAFAVHNATDIVANHGAVGINDTVNVLINVKEHFVLQVFDVLKGQGRTMKAPRIVSKKTKTKTVFGWAKNRAPLRTATHGKQNTNRLTALRQGMTDMAAAPMVSLTRDLPVTNSSMRRPTDGGAIKLCNALGSVIIAMPLSDNSSSSCANERAARRNRLGKGMKHTWYTVEKFRLITASST
jgi:hypothetical protein